MALRIFEDCLEPKPPLRGVTARIKFWPERPELDELDSAVVGLTMTERKKPITVCWKAYKFVDHRFSSYRLVKKVDALVNGARQRLEESGESELLRILRDGLGTGLVKPFCESLTREDRDMRRIQWQDYERLLFYPKGNKRVQLACGDSPDDPARLRCYARFLEIADDENVHAPLRNAAQPLLEWIACLGNPAYHDLLKFDWPMELVSWVVQAVNKAQTNERKKKLAALRVNKHRRPQEAGKWMKERTALSASVMNKLDSLRRMLP